MIGGMVAAIPLSQKTKLYLENKYDIQSLHEFLKEYNLYGGNHAALSESEARLLLGVPGLDAARDRIAEAIEAESLRSSETGVPPLTPHKSKVVPFSSVSKVVDANGETLVNLHAVPVLRLDNIINRRHGGSSQTMTGFAAVQPSGGAGGSPGQPDSNHLRMREKSRGFSICPMF